MRDAGRWLVGRNPLQAHGLKVAWGWLYHSSGSWCFRWCDSRVTRSQSSRLISSLWSWLVIQSRIPHPLHTPAASISRGSGAIASSRWPRRRSETARRGAPAAICGVVSPRSNQFGTGCPIARRAKRRRRPTRRSVRGYRVRVMEKEEFRATQSPYAENRTCGGVGGCRGAIPSTRPDRRIPNDSRMRPFQDLSPKNC